MKQALLIPVKELDNAKHRLSGLLSPEERRELAWLMLNGVLEEAAGLGDSLRKVIVSSYGPALALGERLGFESLGEQRQVSESDSVDRASAQLEQEGVDGVLRLPLDLPLLAVEDLRRILERGAAGLAAVLVPSRDGRGTNALYRSPPGLFPSRFGADSLALHERLARERGAPYAIEPLQSLALDIDDEADLRALLEQRTACPAKEYLERLGLRERIGQAAAGRREGATRLKNGS